MQERARWSVAAGALAAVVLAGCASPGPPLPPSLQLPQVATDVSAARVGDKVTLRWTTPERTTDKLLIQGMVTAVVCRENMAALPQIPAGTKAVLTFSVCSPVEREQVRVGASEAEDVLPAELTAGTGVVAYRVELLNQVGRMAGASAPVYVAAGPTPAAVEGLRATATKRGVVLEWKRAAGADEAVELNRTWLNQPVAAAGAGKASLLPLTPKEPAEVRLGAGTAAGTVDAGAQIGHSYSYTAQRVRTVELGGQKLEVRSTPSAVVTVKVEDVFAPDAPAGLVAAPGLSTSTPVVAVIALSWEPSAEARVAGYRVYRRDMPDGAWRALRAELVQVAAYDDATVTPGKSYAYRVTAVSGAGVESAASAAVTETAPAAP